MTNEENGRKKQRNMIFVRTDKNFMTINLQRNNVYDLYRDNTFLM